MSRVKETADVIIIGSGVMGCSTAYYLTKRGKKVLVLEAGMIGHGASCRSGGGVRQSARDVRELQVAIYGVKNIWPTLSEELGVDVEYHQDGNLRIGKTEAHHKTLLARTASCVEAGLDVYMVDDYEIHQMIPCLGPDVVTASFCPTDGHANPLKTTLGYYRAARRLGAHFITGEQVIRLGRYKGRIREVWCASGNLYEAEQVIVTAGWWSRDILATVGIDIPMHKCIDQEIVTEPLPFMFKQMLGTAEAHFHGRQADNGGFTIGDHTGLEIHHNNSAHHPAGTKHFMGVACRDVIDYIPCLKDAKIIRHWAGWLAKTPDDIPVIDAVDELPGLIVGCGFSGHGFGIGPAAGHLLCQLAMEEEPDVDISALNYHRFDGRC